MFSTLILVVGGLVLLVGLGIAAAVAIAIATGGGGLKPPAAIARVVDVNGDGVLDLQDVRELTKELDTRHLPVVSDVILGLVNRDFLRAAKAARKLLAVVRSGDLQIRTEADEPAAEK
jgi:hypothetical protein